MNRKGFRDPRFDDLAAFALGALDPEERSQVEELLARSQEAQRELAAMQETVAAVGMAAPEAELPAGLKDRLMAAAARPVRAVPLRAGSAAASRNGSSVRPWPLGAERLSGTGRGRRLARRAAAVAAASGIAAAVALAVIFAVRTSRLEDELDAVTLQASQERAAAVNVQATVTALENQMASASEQAGRQEQQVSRLAEANVALQSAMQDQRWLTYVTFNRNWESPSWFRAGTEAPSAQGQLIVSPGKDRAVLIVDGMPELTEGYEYRLWLVGPGWRWPGADFEVNEYGYARVEVALAAGVEQFTNAVITRQQAGTASDASGTEVLTAPAIR
jgi:anti-sigma factor RsiW